MPLWVMNMVLWSALARALKFYLVNSIPLTMEPHHFHLMLRVIHLLLPGTILDDSRTEETAAHLLTLENRKVRKSEYFEMVIFPC